MKNNSLQIFSILAVIVIIIMGVVLIMFNNASTEQIAKMNDAVNRATEAEKRERDAKMAVLTLKQLIGHKDETDTQAIQQAFETDMMRYAKGDASSKSYRIALANIANELAKKNDEHKNTQNALLELQTNYDNRNAMYETVVNQFSQAQKKAVDDLTSARKDFAATVDAQKKEIAVVQADKDRAVQEAEEQVKAAQTKADEETLKANTATLRNSELAGVLDDLRRTNFDRPHGKIDSVNQQSGLVIINLGGEDGLMTRMTFSVYNPSITGISFGSTKPVEETVICDVCKREASLNAAKASIEVVRILGPHKAEARILDDRLTDPIVAGDVIHTPIWKPGQKQHFALASGMRIPGVGKRDGDTAQGNLQEIMRLIAANGGVVDSYIADGSEEGKKKGDIEGEITRDTTFLVIGDLSDEDQQDQTTMESQSKMIKTAEQLAVKQISLRELLARMAWKNVTPVRGFGKFADESDHAITPTGENRASVGVVSPIYQKPNNAARVTNEERAGRPSPGTVSGLYLESATPGTSTGQTSDLFRPRKPGSSRSDLAE